MDFEFDDYKSTSNKKKHKIDGLVKSPEKQKLSHFKAPLTIRKSEKCDSGATTELTFLKQ